MAQPTPEQLTSLLTSNPWFGTEGPRNADIMFVGESWGLDEVKKNTPFTGSAGKEFDRLLADCKIDRKKCFITSVLPYMPPGGKLSKLFHKEGKEPKWGCNVDPLVIAGLAALRTQIQTVRPKVIVTMGNFAMWALAMETPLKKLKKEEGGQTVPSGITDWRGSMLFTRMEYGAPIPVLPIFHPSMLFREWTLRPYMVTDLCMRLPMALADNWRAPTDVVLNPLPTFPQAVEFLNKLISTKVAIPVVCDIETKAKNITCIGFATSRKYAICIPLVTINKDRTMGHYWTPQQEFILYRLLRKLFLCPQIQWVGQNFLYDMQYLSVWYTLGNRMRFYFDTMYAYHTMFPGLEKGLDVLSSIICNHHVFWKHETQEWLESGTIEQLLLYNCKDCVATFEIYEELSAAVTKSGMTPQWEYMKQTAHTIFRMMHRGLRRDLNALNAMRVSLLDLKVPRENKLLTYVPQNWVPGKQKTLWFNSSKQAMTIFYEVLGLTPQINRKTKNPSIDDEALNALKVKHPLFKRVLQLVADLRSIRVFQGLYIDSYVDPDRRFRTSFNPAGTETFRLSSSKNAFHRGGNLQNISSGDE